MTSCCLQAFQLPMLEFVTKSHGCFNEQEAFFLIMSNNHHHQRFHHLQLGRTDFGIRVKYQSTNGKKKSTFTRLVFKTNNILSLPLFVVAKVACVSPQLCRSLMMT
ncbi:hypothetical protein AHF37_10354 [Paragonimus kellicotti]|nr:hypothetical protein AHF37_10354 [Paragonimus kellicotti]